MAKDFVNSSYMWSSLMIGKKVVDSRSYFRVGDGLSIDVVHDPWISTLPNFILDGPVYSRLYGLKVGDLD